MLSVRRINLGEVELYRRLRLAALEDSPDAFTTSYESALSRTDESWVMQADEAAIGEDRAIFIAHFDGATAGLAALYRSPDEPDHGELIQMWVAPDFRGKHLAVALVETAVEWARRSRFKAIKASVTNGNARAASLYKKCGFIPSGPGPSAPEQEFELKL
jgi:RimJ/RimL family protein N-acetyltransferase